MENKEKVVQEIFNEIAGDYDRMNRILTGGFFTRWQSAVLSAMEIQGNENILDICCGSGEMTLALQKRLDQGGQAIGIDFSEKMLALAGQKAEKAGLSIPFLFQDAQALEFQDECFDKTVNAFALRNVADIPRTLSEMHRVLKRGGESYILEVARPGNPLIRLGFDLYYFQIVPLLGRLAFRRKENSQSLHPYSWLSLSLKEFPAPEEILTKMEAAGFTEVKSRSYGFGGIMMYTGKKSLNIHNTDL